MAAFCLGPTLFYDLAAKVRDGRVISVRRSKENVKNTGNVEKGGSRLLKTAPYSAIYLYVLRYPQQ
jgi:hypothetical protein